MDPAKGGGSIKTPLRTSHRPFWRNDPFCVPRLTNSKSDKFWNFTCRLRKRAYFSANGRETWTSFFHISNGASQKTGKWSFPSFFGSVGEGV